ncbi:hypothetical protein FO519_005779 [Halicephalobus sp. NKZ332]|nr:hypothetical protein FO519_005779 [Halicephalobus sp. NKZ332]
MSSTTPNKGLNQDDTGNFTEFPSYCTYEEPPLMFVRFILVTVIGSLVSCVKAHRTSYNVYLMLLAFFDFFISLAYVMLMSVNVLTDFLHSVSLLRLWMSYVIPMITVSHIAMTTSSFLIVAASLERYCISTNSKYRSLVQRNRKWIAFIAVCFGIISKGTMPLELDRIKTEECTGLMTEWGLGMKEFVFDTPYHVVWRLWYRNIATVFFPFFVLAFFNIKIVIALRHNPKESTAGMKNGELVISPKQRSRNATRTMICVVSCYLISNIINVLVTFLEHFDKKLLESHQKEYAISLDVVSLATNVSCLLRVPIYMVCQPVLRREIMFTLKHWIRCQHARRSALDENNTNAITTTSMENTYLISENVEKGFPVNGNTKTNGHFTNGNNMGLPQMKNNHGTLFSSYNEDQHSISSSVTAQHDILNKLIRGSDNETLL